jgi:hypothetical protein
VTIAPATGKSSHGTSQLLHGRTPLALTKVQCPTGLALSLRHRGTRLHPSVGPSRGGVRRLVVVSENSDNFG